MKNNYNLPPSEYDIYCEGLFDRLRARGAGLVNKLTGGPSTGGYNQGKSVSFKAIFKSRMVKDIDKFLREVTKLGVADLAEFEQKYPDIAQKIACMADQIGHTTPLRTQCKKQEEEKQEEDKIIGVEAYSCKDGKCVPDPLGQFKTKEECEAKCSGNGNNDDDDDDAITPPPRKKRWACRADGTCYSRPDGKYASKEECEAKCKARKLRGRRNRGGQNQYIGRDNNGNQVMMGDVINSSVNIVNKNGLDLNDPADRKEFLDFLKKELVPMLKGKPAAKKKDIIKSVFSATKKETSNSRNSGDTINLNYDQNSRRKSKVSSPSTSTYSFDGL
jgi:hypothetical protein